MTNEQIRANTSDLTFTVPPQCQGQIVTRGYAADEDYIYVRLFDASDQTTTIYVHEHPDSEERSDFEPWNRIPKLGERVGRIDGWILGWGLLRRAPSE